MQERDYDRVLLFSGVLSSIGFPDEIKEKLENRFGSISFISKRIPFDFTSYYDKEMGTPIERFFIAFERLINPDELTGAKHFTNSLEDEFKDDGNRNIN